MTGELKTYGWNEFFEDQLGPSDKSLVIGRVIRHDADGYRLITGHGPMTGILTGSMRHQSQARINLPAVGDWVVGEDVPGDEAKIVIRRRLERSSCFSRKESGERLQQQVIAANIDLVFIVSGLDQNFNPSRIQRFVLMTTESGAKPIIILNKLDVCDDLETRLTQLDKVIPGIQAFAVSALTGQGMADIQGLVTSGETTAVLGSSGVGKSTMINWLLGEQHFDTQAVRSTDSKGRHTTTHREIVLMSGGGLLIDTPGIRELQIWADENTLNERFDDIEELAMQCRFTNCLHQGEPGCAVTEALRQNLLTYDRLSHYQKLQEEVSTLAEKQSGQFRRRKQKGPAKRAPGKFKKR